MADITSTVFRLAGNLLYKVECARLREMVAHKAEGFLEREGTLPHMVVTALLWGEDHRSPKHRGIDFWSLCRAVVRFRPGRPMQGASTIEQQLVRTLLRDYRRSLGRKIREMMLAASLYPEIEKQRIYVAYLEIAHYGIGIDGYRMACRKLRIDPANPSIWDAANLVARLKYPEPREPDPRWAEKITRRAAYIVSRALGTKRATAYLERIEHARISELS